MLVSERIGQFFVDAGSGRDRLEYTEYGAGDHWVVLLHGRLIPRRMHQPLARALAAEGLHVVTLDLLGHGRSDRPADPLVYSMSAFAEQDPPTHMIRLCFAKRDATIEAGVAALAKARELAR